MPYRHPHKSSQPSWLTHTLNYYWLHDVLRVYLGLSVWVIRWDGKKGVDWMEMTPESSASLSPVHFEKFFGKEEERDAYYLKNLRRLDKTKGFVIDQLGGFYDCFLPLQKEGKGLAALYANYFLKEAPRLDGLKLNWQKLTGKQASAADPDFLHYVRMALKLPVLNGALLKASLEFLKCYAQFLTGRAAYPLWQRVDHLRRRVFSAELPNAAWVEQALGAERFIPTPWDWYGDRQLAPWMKEELGISRIPTLVIAAMPLRQGRAQVDAAEALLENSALQRACQLFARSLPETVAGKLQDYGMFFLTSPRGKSEVQARLEIRERAEKIREFISKKSGLRAVAGIGRPVAAGAVLSASYREAVLALHLCVQTEKPLLFYQEDAARPKGSGYQRVHASQGKLLTAFEKASAEGMKPASENYVREVLEFSGRDESVVRSLFCSLLFQMLDRLRRSVLHAGDLEAYAAGFGQGLAEADSIYRLIEIFKETLQGLSAFLAKPLEGAKNLRMQSALNYLGEHFRQPLRLGAVAKQAGFSVPVFCRLFKKTTGLGFVAYVNKLRVEEAKNLLRTSGLNVLQVGQACGFQNSHHFIRNFKQSAHLTPGEYRQRNSPTENL